MSSYIKRYGGERAAASLAYEDGLEWNDLTPEEKERYYAKASQKKMDKQTTRPVGQGK